MVAQPLHGFAPANGQAGRMRGKGAHDPGVQPDSAGMMIGV